MGELVTAEYTYEIIGLIYAAYTELGFGFQEKYYQRSFEQALKRASKQYRKEVSFPITVDDRIIGRYFIDFIVEDRLVVEWKVANEFYESHINQVLGYLKASGLSLGLIARVTPHGVKIKRVIA